MWRGNKERFGIMPKRATSIKNPKIVLDQRAPAPLYRQLYERLRTAILTGRLETGARLPSTRTLASELGISRNTTALAYQLLLLEGYLEARVGDGTRVARLPTERLSRGAVEAGERRAEDTAGTPMKMLGMRGQLLIETSRTEAFSDRADTGTGVMRIGQPDVTYFPYETWARLVARHARRSLQAVALYQGAQGFAPLREVIAAHIAVTRGVRCSPEQIILTAGSQGALDLIARVLLDPGDPAWVEDPGYLGARGALLGAGAQVVAVPVDQEGLDVAAGRRLRLDARLVVVTPSHQFPTGVTMCLSRRLALLDWARETHAWIVEDDYDSEFRFGGRPLEALQGLDDAERVIYVGTFSKTLFPSLRLGYLVAPARLIPGFLAARHRIDVHLPLLEQLALADFIADGHFARHVRKMRVLYLERRDALVDALKRELGDILEVTAPEAGMHLAAWLPQEMSAETVAQRAAARGLRVLPLSRFSLRPLERDGLLLGFAGAAPDELRAGVRTLALALRAHR
jgi:GntR family transcriptional regulator / MocR family aminotransferase